MPQSSHLEISFSAENVLIHVATDKRWCTNDKEEQKNTEASKYQSKT